MKHNFKVGERAYIRQWDDMVEEYGLHGADRIDTPKVFFTDDMIGFCGMEVEIEEVDECGYVILRWTDENSSAWGNLNDFFWNVGMLEPIEEKE